MKTLNEVIEDAEKGLLVKSQAHAEANTVLGLSIVAARCLGEAAEAFYALPSPVPLS